MTSNNETVSHQNLWAGGIAKSMTSEGNIFSVMLTAVTASVKKKLQAILTLSH